MKYRIFISSLVFFLMISFVVKSQNTNGKVETYPVNSETKLNGKIQNTESEQEIKDTIPDKNIVDPIKVLWMGAIIPGYGQYMNKKYWKLPIVYGGFLGCTYAITYNTIRYNAYRNGYRDIIDTDATTNSFLEILPSGATVNDYGGISAYTNVLKTGMEKFRYNRDMMVIVSVGYYAITLIDAYVDAQLSDFDISDDLSMRIKPTLLNNPYDNNRNCIGLQCCLYLK